MSRQMFTSVSPVSLRVAELDTQGYFVHNV